jgi:hypothetical protein
MARAPRLVWVVTALGPLLAAKQRLERRVDVVYPRRTQGMLHALEQRLVHPFPGLLHLRLLRGPLSFAVL